MKTKINPKLRKLLSKHFANQVFGRVGVPISATREDIADYCKGVYGDTDFLVMPFLDELPLVLGCFLGGFCLVD